MTERWRWWRHEHSDAAVFVGWTDWGLRVSYDPHRFEVTLTVQIGPAAWIYWRRRKAHRSLAAVVEMPTRP